MVARFYGRDYSTEMLRRRCHISRRGVNMLGISEGAQYIGLEAVGVKLTFDQLVDEGVFPCIIYWNQNHFVVCYGIERDSRGGHKVHIADPASQRLTYTREEFEKCWIGRHVDKESRGVALIWSLETNGALWRTSTGRTAAACCRSHTISLPIAA